MKADIEYFRCENESIGLSMELKNHGESAYEKMLIGGHTRLYTEPQIEKYLESVSEEFQKLQSDYDRDCKLHCETIDDLKEQLDELKAQCEKQMKIPKWVAEILDKAIETGEGYKGIDKAELWAEQTEDANYIVIAYLNPLTRKYVEVVK